MAGTPSNDLNISQAGYVNFDGVATFTGRTFQAGAGITITNGSGVAGDTTIALSGGSSAVEHLTGTTGGQLNPTANNFNLLGGTVAAGTTPVAIAGSGSTLTTNLQISQAIASAVATKIGLANFDSASFAVSATGFVTASGTGLGKTITGDSGGALSPTAGNWNILGGVNGKTSGSGSTLSVRADILTYLQPGAYPYTALDSDYFISVTTTAAARTINLPNAPTTGKSYIIKDRTGNAAANPITITTVGGVVLIDGATSYNMNSNYGSIGVMFNGSSYEIF